MRTPHALIRPSRRHLRSVALLAAALLALAACGGDDGDQTAEDAAGDLASQVEEAEGVLSDAGVDTDAGGTAEVEFMGETIEMVADQQFGCLVLEDGGSDGAVDFTARDEETIEQNGDRELAVSWSGDSPESSQVDLVTADGTEWTGPMDGQVEATITEPSAAVTATVSAFDGDSGRDEAEIVVSVTCGQ